MGSVAAAASADGFELEAKRKEDSSWHPCQVSLSSDDSTNVCLIVDFGDHDSEDFIFTKEDALARLRIRSTPLQGDECSHIKEGERVVALQNTKFGDLFFDAEVKKVCRVRHSKRNQCRCSFEIKWLSMHSRVGTVTIPACSIMKLAAKTVDSHPTVCEFLDSIKTLDGSDVSSIVSLYEETVFDTDLEKQIEEISRLADVYGKGTPKDCLFELKKEDLTGQVRHRTIASQLSTLQDQGSRDKNTTRRTTRNQRKTQVESEKVSPPPQPITKEPDRPYLTPLGARAALASLMYKSPMDQELSAHNEERVGFTNTVQSTTMISLNVTSTFVDSDVHIQKKVSVKDNLLSSREASPTGHQMTGKRLAKSGRAPSGIKGADADVAAMKRSSTDSLSDKAVKIPTRVTRLTRSAIRKGAGFPNDEVEQNSSFDEVTLSGPTIQTPRFTRLLEQTEISATMEVGKGVPERKSAKKTDSKFTPPTNQRRIGHSDDEIDLKSAHRESKLLTPTPRTTRSAKQKEPENFTVEVNKGQEESKSAQGTGSESSQEDLVTPRPAKTRRKKPLSSTDDAEIVSKAQESQKKQRVSNNKGITKSGGKLSEAGTPLPDGKSDLSKTKLEPQSSTRVTRSRMKQS